jgi:hypothetical protein
MGQRRLIMKKIVSWMDPLDWIVLGILVVCLLLIWIPIQSSALDRCDDYISDARSASLRYGGPSWPWWYNLGQLKQESICRTNITAYDGGRGIAQFMPATIKYVAHMMGQNTFNPYNPHQAIKAQAAYLANISSKSNWSKDKKMFMTFMIYNGGTRSLEKEAKRAGKIDYIAMKKQCHRNIVHLKKGKKIDMCTVAYSYPKQVYNNGQVYRHGTDGMIFW